MAYETTKTKALKKALSSKETQKKVVNQVVNMYDDGRKARQDKEQTWLSCWRAYVQYINHSKYQKVPWRSKLATGWSFSAVESFSTEMMNLLFPDDEDFFGLSARTSTNEQQDANSEVMEKCIRYQFQECSYFSTVRKALKEAAITGMGVYKVFWKEDIIDATVQNEYGVLQQTEVPRFSGPAVQHVPVIDFVLYPAVGSIEDATCIHRYIAKKDQLVSNPYYFNTNKLDSENGYRWGQSSNVQSYLQEINNSFGIEDKYFEEDQGIEVLEAWGDFEIDGVMYRNYVATVGNNVELLRFEPNPYEMGLKPFVVLTIRDVPGQVYPIGILEPALNLQRQGNTITNILMDNEVMNIHGEFKAVPDNVFDAASFMSRPGGVHWVSDINNLVPLEKNAKLSLGLEYLQYLKGEFEEITGVTKYAKGIEGSQQYRTATEASRIANASSKQFIEMAKSISRTALVHTVRLFYSLTRLYSSPDQIAAQVGVDPLAIDFQMPLNLAQVKITGIQTALLESETVERMERAFTGIGRTPGANFLNWAEADKLYLKLLKIPGFERLIVDTEMQEAISQKQQADALGIPPDVQLMAMREAGNVPI